MSSVSATPTSYPCYSASSLAFSASSLAFSARALAFSTFFNFFFSIAIWVLEEANRSSALRSSSLWFSACFSTFSRVTAAYFISFSSSYNLFLSSWRLLSATRKASTAAICLPSSSFPMAVIGHLFYQEGGLNSLSRKETRIRERG